MECLCNKEYKKLEGKDIKFLRDLLGEERVFIGEDISEDFSHDELGGISKMPETVVEVLTTEEVSKIMNYAYENNIPVVARGSGTGLSWGICSDLWRNNDKFNKNEQNS